MQEIIRIDLRNVNCYLVKGGKGFVLFDTGGPLILDKVFTVRRKELLKQLSEAGCTEDNLSLIVLTHGDCDHISNAAYLRERFNAKIAMHKGDRAFTENPTLDKWMENSKPRSVVLKLAFKIMDKNIRKAIGNALEKFTPFSPDIFLNDGDSLSDYGLDAAVIHTPGHTDGSIAFLFKNGDIIIGDSLANNNKPAPALNAKNFTQMDESIKKVKGMPVKKVYPGHGTPFEL